MTDERTNKDKDSFLLRVLFRFCEGNGGANAVWYNMQ